jgi:uncharacterized membrane protein YGL010W
MRNPFRPATELMVQYAAYHRDRRNLSMHFLGIPLIVFAIGVLLARAHVDAGALRISAAGIAWGLGALWYATRGNLVLGVATGAATGVLVGLAAPLGAGTTAAWLGRGLTIFGAGWLLQLLGHYYEGRRPAFVDDLVGLLVGPMFVVGEALFSLGLCRPLADEIVRRTGPTTIRDLAHPAA